MVDFGKTHQMKGLRKIAKGVVPLLQVIAILFVVNTIINQHYHILSSGIILKHSHPFHKGWIGDPPKEHNHTSSEYLFLEQMSNTTFWISLCLISFAFIFNHLIINIFTGSKTHDNPELYFLLNYHAPPEF